MKKKANKIDVNKRRNELLKKKAELITTLAKTLASTPTLTPEVKEAMDKLVAMKTKEQLELNNSILCNIDKAYGSLGQECPACSNVCSNKYQLVNGNVYSICEDCITLYWSAFPGGFAKVPPSTNNTPTN